MTSQVVSFRLNENDASEARALEILNEGLENGWSYRRMIVRALLALNGEPFPLEDLAGLMTQLREAIRMLQQTGAAPAAPSANADDLDTLSQAFLAGIKKTYRPGRKAEQED